MLPPPYSSGRKENKKSEASLQPSQLPFTARPFLLAFEWAPTVHLPSNAAAGSRDIKCKINLLLYKGSGGQGSGHPGAPVAPISAPATLLGAPKLLGALPCWSPARPDLVHYLHQQAAARPTHGSKVRSLITNSSSSHLPLAQSCRPQI